MTIRLVLALIPLLLVVGCASTAPEAIRSPLPGSPDLAEVREDPPAHVGERVRWGGTIAKVHNGDTNTRLEVVGRPLTSQGRPASGDTTSGRFLAEVPGFLDPAVYSRGREITVTGRLAEPETRPIGEFDYRFPVVRVQDHHLWPAREQIRRPLPPDPWYWDPWYRDPWYRDPWYPYYGPPPPYW